VISIEQRLVASVLAALVAAVIVPPVAHVSSVAGIVALAGALALQVPLARFVPASLAGARHRRPVVCGAWILLSVFAIAQTGRLSVFMTDFSRRWGSTVPDLVAVNHQCLGAYMHAADLARQHVPNLYAAEWYPAYAGACGVPSNAVGVRGLGRWVVDPYLYPPQFLVLPRLALYVTNSFDVIRTGWFVCQSLLFLAAAVALTRWLDASAGLVWLLLVPAVLASPSTMLNLQFGQFHVVAMILACAAMVLFDIGWSATGGVLLAFAILSKISPGILLIPLAVERRWRDLAWTFAGIAAWTAAGVLILGVAPFTAFIAYEIPRLISGAAFSFVDLPSQSVFVMSRNFSITGIGARLRLLGVPSPTHTQLMLLAWAFTFVVIWFATRLQGGGTRTSRLIGWLALLNLAALRAPAAPSAYVVVPALWMLALLASEGDGRRWWSAGIALAWIVVVGPPPLPNRIDLILSGIGQAAMIAICVWVLLRSPVTAATIIHSCSAPTASGSVLEPTLARAVSRGRRSPPPDRRRDRSLA
jgi:hypothetical protein